jgi:hypothetical protein
MTAPAPVTHPKGWSRADLERDRSWIHRLTPEESDELLRGLAALKACGRGLFDTDRSDFPIGPAVRRMLDEAVEQTQTGCGFRMLRGVPIAGLSDADVRLLFWGIGLQLGVARPQGKASAYLADVRDIGVDYRSATGRGHTSKAALDFHSDGSDLVGLLVLRGAVSGGTSLISSSIRAHNEMLASHPDLVAALYEPIHHGRQGEHAPEEPPYYTMSVFGEKDGHFACRFIRNHIRGGQATYPEIPRLTARQIAALDLLDATLVRDDLCLRIEFEPGDIQLINNHIVLHSRTDYEDHADPAMKRHLLRLWLALPGGQPLPDNWAHWYKDIAPGSVRGGMRGLQVGPVQEAFEQRLARSHGMGMRIYFDRRAHEAGQVP